MIVIIGLPLKLEMRILGSISSMLFKALSAVGLILKVSQKSVLSLLSMPWQIKELAANYLEFSLKILVNSGKWDVDGGGLVLKMWICMANIS